MIHVCVPVLNRYDLLRELLLSLQASTLQPARVYVVDNGRRPEDLSRAMAACPVPYDVHSPATPMGLAEAWNWFVANVPEDRLIANDDVTFAPDSLMSMAAKPASFVSCTFGFSCFILRDACVAAVGLFDESISPGYAYFEDMDYLRRMKVVGVCDDVVECGVVHRRSSTPSVYTTAEAQEHHRRFDLARQNYERKWKDGPSWDQLAAIGGAGANA